MHAHTALKESALASVTDILLLVGLPLRLVNQDCGFVRLEVAADRLPHPKLTPLFDMLNSSAIVFHFIKVKDRIYGWWLSLT